MDGLKFHSPHPTKTELPFFTSDQRLRLPRSCFELYLMSPLPLLMLLALTSRATSFSPSSFSLARTARAATPNFSSSSSFLSSTNPGKGGSSDSSDKISTPAEAAALPTSLVYTRTSLNGRYRPPLYEPSDYRPPPSALADFTETPKLVTFDCTGTIMQLTSAVGMFYREELFKVRGTGEEGGSGIVERGLVEGGRRREELFRLGKEGLGKEQVFVFLCRLYFLLPIVCLVARTMLLC